MTPEPRMDEVEVKEPEKSVPNGEAKIPLETSEKPVTGNRFDALSREEQGNAAESTSESVASKPRAV